MAQCRDLENHHHEKLLETSINTLEKIVKGELDDDLPDDVRAVSRAARRRCGFWLLFANRGLCWRVSDLQPPGRLLGPGWEWSTQQPSLVSVAGSQSRQRFLAGHSHSTARLQAVRPHLHPLRPTTQWPSSQQRSWLALPTACFLRILEQGVPAAH